METVREIWAFLRIRKRFWLAPIILALVILMMLIVAAGHAGPVGSLMYAL